MSPVAATHPLPTTAAASVAETPVPAYARSVEERVAVLETHWEDTGSKLATGLAIRADMQAQENRLIKWIIGAAIAAAGIFVAMHLENTSRIEKMEAKTEKIEAKIEKMEAKIDAKLEKIDEKFEKIDERFQRIDEKFQKMDERFEKINEKFEKMDEKFERMDAKFDALLRELREKR